MTWVWDPCKESAVAPRRKGGVYAIAECLSLSQEQMHLAVLPRTRRPRLIYLAAGRPSDYWGSRDGLWSQAMQLATQRAIIRWERAPPPQDYQRVPMDPVSALLVPFPRQTTCNVWPGLLCMVGMVERHQTRRMIADTGQLNSDSGLECVDQEPAGGNICGLGRRQTGAFSTLERREGMRSGHVDICTHSHIHALPTQRKPAVPSAAAARCLHLEVDAARQAV
jgi:hypothetical protein